MTLLLDLLFLPLSKDRSHQADTGFAGLSKTKSHRLRVQPLIKLYATDICKRTYPADQRQHAWGARTVYYPRARDALKHGERVESVDDHRSPLFRVKEDPEKNKTECAAGLRCLDELKVFTSEWPLIVPLLPGQHRYDSRR